MIEIVCQNSVGDSDSEKTLPSQINCAYYLNSLTKKNGPIAVVPGSQKALFKPPNKDFEFPDQKIIYAKNWASNTF